MPLNAATVFIPDGTEKSTLFDDRRASSLSRNVTSIILFRKLCPYYEISEMYNRLIIVLDEVSRGHTDQSSMTVKGDALRYYAYFTLD